MRFREFYNDSVFTLLAKDSANWDYYAMQYQGGMTRAVEERLARVTAK